MSKQLVPLTRGERGMTTAEYAVGVIAVIALVGVFISVIIGGPFAAAMSDLALKVIDTISGMFAK